jgi:cryptochrome
LPILKNYPREFIFEPWKAPLDIQKKCKCIIGVDYPFPIVDHDVAKEKCLTKMKSAYQV